METEKKTLNKVKEKQPEQLCVSRLFVLKRLHLSFPISFT